MLIYFEVKENEKIEREDQRRKVARNRISMKSIELRFPFVSLIEFYCLKKYFNPYFAKNGLSDGDAWQMRKELYREKRKRAL